MLNFAPAPSAKSPRPTFGVGASAPARFTSGNSAVTVGEILCAVKVSAPPGAATLLLIVTFDPASVMEPSAGVVRFTPAGTVMTPSGLLMERCPKPPSEKSSEERVTDAIRSCASGAGAPPTKRNGPTEPCGFTFANVTAGGVGEVGMKLSVVGPSKIFCA